MKAASATRVSQYRERSFYLWAAHGFERRLRIEGLTDAHGYERAMQSAKRVVGGRSHNWILEEHDPGRPIRVRPSRHGGALAPWLRDRSLTRSRSYRELSIWLTLRQRKVQLPIPVFAMSRRRGLFWQSAFASLECENAQDGVEWLGQEPSPSRLRKISLAFANSIRQFHDAGAIHGDLQLRNILIEFHSKGPSKTGTHCMLIDLDRTRIVSKISPRQRMSDLSRLLRSFEKTGHGHIASKRLRAFTLSCYCGGDRALRQSMLRSSRIEAIGMWRHRFAWRIESLLSSRRREAESKRSIAD